MPCSAICSAVYKRFYSGTASAQPVWDSPYASSGLEINESIVMATVLGMTESALFGLFVISTNVKFGALGIPTLSLQLSVVSVNGKIGVRYEGPQHLACPLARA